MDPRWEVRYRVHSTNLPVVFDPFVEQLQKLDHKPEGLWFTPTENDWRDWCLSDAPSWLIDTKVSRIEVDLSRVLRLTSTAEIRGFTRQFSVDPFSDLGLHGTYSQIDWRIVAEQYDGIEIAPYNHELRLSRDCFWYYTWDVASGCVWRDRSVRTWNENNSPPLLTSSTKSTRQRSSRQRSQRSRRAP